MSLRVMLVEDEKDIRENICDLLESDGMEVTSLENGDNFIDVLRKTKPSVVLLDQRLPGLSGVELLKQVRADSEFEMLPVIMVTGLCGEEDAVRALELGADDYITKPFAPRVLSLKVKNIARRNVDFGNHGKTVRSGNLCVDPSTYKVFVNDREIHLTLTEYKILAELMRENGKVLTRENLCRRVLGHSNVTSRTIDVHMSALRKKLNEVEAVIETVRGVGYRLSCS